MTETIITFAYVLGYVFTTWRIVGQVAWGDKAYNAKIPNGGDVAFGCFVGFFAGFFWPFVLPVSYMVSHGGNGGKYLYTPPKYKDQLMKVKLEEKERRIRELEREVLEK